MIGINKELKTALTKGALECLYFEDNVRDVTFNVGNLAEEALHHYHTNIEFRTWVDVLVNCQLKKIEENNETP